MSDTSGKAWRQAIDYLLYHNMNLMFNLEETVGLRLKPSAF